MFKKFTKNFITVGLLGLGVQFSALAESTISNDAVKPIEYVGNYFTEKYVNAYEIDSEILGRKILIEVFGENVDFEQAVTYVTDGNFLGWGSFVNDSMREGDNGPKAKPMLTVAIDYTHQQYQEGLNNEYRFLDLTHVRDETLPQIPSQGGAEEFLRFINEEVKPFIYSKYKINKNDETFFGHSLGGLFSLYALFTKPDSFDRYLISSPSIWWSNKDILNLEESYAAEHQDMDKYLYFGVGSEEDFMVADMQDMIKRLSNRGYKNLKLLQDIFPGAGHLEAGLYSSLKGKHALVNEEYMSLPNWENGQVYTKGQRVRYLGHVYQAKWWTQNEQPVMNSDYRVWLTIR